MSSQETGSSNGASSASTEADDARPGAALDGPATETWQAYNAMQTTKQRHFALLQLLENKKKKFNLGPTDQERKMQAWLLADHDAQVKRFTHASTELRTMDEAAHTALFEYIGLLNQAASGEGDAIH